MIRNIMYKKQMLCTLWYDTYHMIRMDITRGDCGSPSLVKYKKNIFIFAIWFTSRGLIRTQYVYVYTDVHTIAYTHTQTHTCIQSHTRTSKPKTKKKQIAHKKKTDSTLTSRHGPARRARWCPRDWKGCWKFPVASYHPANAPVPAHRHLVGFRV